MATEKVAVVTGGSRGIGLAIASELARKGLRVVIAARDPERGERAAAELRKEKLDVLFLPLDVSSLAEIDRFPEAVRAAAGAVHVLVNNAGVLLDNEQSGLTVSAEIVRRTLEINTVGPLLLSQRLVPFMREAGYGRIVNMSSGLGALCDMGGGHPAYRISKTGLNAVTRILAAELEHDNILVNSVCPGWVRTDMGGPNAPRTPAQGADTAVYLATLPDGGPTGRFFRDRREIDW